MSAKAQRQGLKRAYGVKAGVTLDSNKPAVLDGGYLAPVTDGAGTALSAGVTTLEVDNSAGTNGVILAEVVAGEHKFTNSGDIAVNNVGSTAYFVDDATVSLSHATNTRNVAGTIIQVDGDGAWVALGQ